MGCLQLPKGPSKTLSPSLRKIAHRKINELNHLVSWLEYTIYQSIDALRFYLVVRAIGPNGLVAAESEKPDRTLIRRNTDSSSWTEE